MLYYISFAIATVVAVASVCFAIFRIKARKKHSDILTTTNILLVGVVVSAFLMFLPIYVSIFKDKNCSFVETVLISVHNMIRLFIVDGDFDFVLDNMETDGWLSHAYTLFFAVLFVAAPMLTFGFVLSFFKNVSAYLSLIRNFRSDMYIFSDLTEKSLVLAESIMENGRQNRKTRTKEEDGKKMRRRLCVFTDVDPQKGEETQELINRAHELGAICFKKDITIVDFSLHSKKAHLQFFTIGEDHSLNTARALSLLPRYKFRKKTNLYVFSTQAETEMLLNKGYETNEQESRGRNVEIKIRRVNEVRSLINNIMFKDGYRLFFEKAAEEEGESDRIISAVIVGLGRHGKEMLKGLVWLCQMTGYKLIINAYDIDKYAESKFRAECPELMDERFNGSFDVDGEAAYRINIHSDLDADRYEFAQSIRSIPSVTYALVCLGDDERNIAVSLKLRSLCMREGKDPIIQAIVYNADKSEALSGIKNHKKIEYAVECIGNRKETYSEDVIIHSEIEGLALNRHKAYGADEESFWKYDYNYRSSIASAIHKQMKIECGISGIELPKEERSDEQLWAIRKLEHCRWNAYMRTEGFSYAPVRNDMAKVHHCLVPFDALPYEEQIKDDD